MPNVLNNMPLVNIGSDGKLNTIAGMKVIESCNATPCNNNEPPTVNGASWLGVMAVVLDSSRAVGEAWGKRPLLEIERVPYCDLNRLTLWRYWGAAIMDTGAFCHIANA